MASNWFFIGWSFLGLIMGLTLTAFFYFIFTYVKDRIKTWGIPSDKAKFSAYVKAHPDRFKVGELQPINEKEVEDDERKRRDKFRQLEKLRRDSEAQARTARKGRSSLDGERIGELQRRSILQDEPPQYTAKAEQPIKRVERKLKLE